jgi:hypothetical protein
VAEVLDAADLAVFTSEFEGYPIASLEAAAMNVPVIAPDIVGFREQLSTGNFGISYQPSGDVVQDANTVAGLINTKWDYLSSLAANGRPFVADHHDLPDVGRKQAALLRDILSPATPSISAKARKRVHLHVGTPKTGTSSIQWFFDQNRELLHGRGVHYPEEFLSSHAHHAAAWYCLPNRARRSPDAFVPYNSDIEWNQAAEQFVRSIHDSPYGNIVISSETFYRADHKRVAELFNSFDVNIVISLRRQDKYFESAYNQNSKIAGKFFGNDAQERLLNKIDYSIQLDSWSRHFGIDNITVIPFEPRWFPNGLERRFVELIGIDWDRRFKLDIRNTRVNRDCLDFLVRLNALDILPRSRYLEVVNMCEDYSATRPDPPHFRNVFSPDRRREILDRFAESNALVAARYLPSEDALFDTRIEDADIWRPYPGVSLQAADEIAKFVGHRGIDKAVLAKVLRTVG